MLELDPKPPPLALPLSLRGVMFLTFAPGGGEKRYVLGSIGAKLTWVNVTESGAALRPRA